MDFVWIKIKNENFIYYFIFKMRLNDKQQVIPYLKRPSGSKNEEYFTKPEIVQKCCKEINFNDFEFIIEPSAGNGVFLDYFEDKSKIIAIDICPLAEGIIEQDFLQWDYSFLKGKNVLVLGNPPFGKQSSLAKKFIKRSTLFATTIAFILPKSFKKESMNNVFKGFYKEKEFDLPSKSFLIHGKVEYNVPCVFQIWKNGDNNQEDKVKLKPEKFTFIPKSKYVRGERNCIYFHRAGSKSGKSFLGEEKIFTEKGTVKDGYYMIKLPEPINKEIVNEKLNSITWRHNNTVGQKSISQQELIPILNDIISLY